jgi:Na+-transporting NADH:ubiquinone oxidoreductase subunit A
MIFLDNLNSDYTMSKDIRIKKGLDIKLVGEAEKTTSNISVKVVCYALKPEDFHGIIPKLIAKEGTEVKAGESLFYSKSDDRILFPSPVSGKVSRDCSWSKNVKVVSIKIAADGKQDYKDFGKQAC